MGDQEEWKVHEVKILVLNALFHRSGRNVAVKLLNQTQLDILPFLADLENKVVWQHIHVDSFLFKIFSFPGSLKNLAIGECRVLLSVCLSICVCVGGAR